ncbi:MAG: hypothetical protein KKF33_18110 [Alphaproteobacteria bacterium]|nr:hypothetical protein [Alphaproteobacteria bacterium]
MPTTSKPATKTKPLLDLMGNLTQPGQSRGIYEVVIILRANGSSAQIKGFDAPLCADGRYETLPVG